MTKTPEVSLKLKPENNPVEFTLVRDKSAKITYALPGRVGNIVSTFQNDQNAIYHYTDDVRGIEKKILKDWRLDRILGKTDLSAIVDPVRRRILEICAQNKKELIHKEKILLADFSIGDRMEAHVLPLEQITCHCLLTSEIRGQTHVVLAINNADNKTAVEPFTTGGHVAATRAVKRLVDGRMGMSDEDFIHGLFGIIRRNMSKEIKEETGLAIPPKKIRYFAADQYDPSKTHFKIGKNYTKVTKGNEEAVHLFHAEISPEILASMVPDKNDGVGGFVTVSADNYEKLALLGERIPASGTDGNRTILAGGANVIGPENFNEEIRTELGRYVKVFLGLIRGHRS